MLNIAYSMFGQIMFRQEIIEKQSSTVPEFDDFMRSTPNPKARQLVRKIRRTTSEPKEEELPELNGMDVLSTLLYEDENKKSHEVIT